MICFIKLLSQLIQGLNLIRDFPALYTNRAQAYIKLGEYQKAIGDCDWAIRVSVNVTIHRLWGCNSYLPNVSITIGGSMDSQGSLITSKGKIAIQNLTKNVIVL